MTITPPAHPVTFDGAGGLADQAAGHALALNATGIDQWRDQARQRIADLAAIPGREFMVDDVLEHVGLPNEPGVNANNAIGALFTTAHQQGLIVATGERRRTNRRSNHGRYVTVWTGTAKARGGPAPTAAQRGLVDRLRKGGSR